MQSQSVIALVLSLTLLAGAGVAVGPPQDDLRLSAENASTTPGNTASILITVTNTGNETIGGNHVLRINETTVPAGWGTNVSNATVVRGPLAPNETRSATLNVSIPENASASETPVLVELVSGDRVWTNATAVVNVVKPSEETTDRENDRAVDDPTENDSGGGGGFVPVAVGSGSSSWKDQILDLLYENKGLVVVSVIALGLIAYFEHKSD